MKILMSTVCDGFNDYPFLSFLYQVEEQFNCATDLCGVSLPNGDSTSMVCHQTNFKFGVLCTFTSFRPFNQLGSCIQELSLAWLWALGCVPTFGTKLNLANFHSCFGITRGWNIVAMTFFHIHWFASRLDIVNVGLSVLSIHASFIWWRTVLERVFDNPSSGVQIILNPFLGRFKLSEESLDPAAESWSLRTEDFALLSLCTVLGAFLFENKKHHRRAISALITLSIEEPVVCIVTCLVQIAPVATWGGNSPLTIAWPGHLSQSREQGTP